MILRVRQYGEPILRKQGSRIEQFDDALRQLVADMVETMYHHEGAGLAAQQVGLDLQLFVIDLSWHVDLDSMPYMIDGRHPPLSLQMPMAFANTELTIQPSDTIIAEEGCLSFPDIRGDVPRSFEVSLTYQDVAGVRHEMVAGDWLARVLQHEYDHTKGVLFIDRMEARTLRRLETKLKRLKRSARQR